MHSFCITHHFIFTDDKRIIYNYLKKGLDNKQFYDSASDLMINSLKSQMAVEVKNTFSSISFLWQDF